MSENFDFATCFREATGYAPYPYQRRLALDPDLPDFLDVPTGLGKTAVILAWVWRRCFASEEIRRRTPRRLVYCLPMRVLAGQTYQNAVRWLDRLDLLAGRAEWEGAEAAAMPAPGSILRSYRALPDDNRLTATGAAAGRKRIAIYLLMGGEERMDWALWPERDAILVGTQDMLLSRALNRGYAASRARWPREFGLLHQDCLWVFDEVQLMGSGLATTAQLEAFRRAERDCDSRTLWMSATLQQDWVATVDFAPLLSTAKRLTFNFDEEIEGASNAAARDNIKARWSARKTLRKAKARVGDAKALADEILQAHQDACQATSRGTRTIAVVNTVRRARELFGALGKLVGKFSRKKAGKGATTAATAGSHPGIVLLHSRYRPPDRDKRMAEALAAPGPGGTVVVSTQVVEAGVDVSATTLFTDLAPWASLVQRFGRCNRSGDDNDAGVFWVDTPEDEKKAEKAALPYNLDDLETARNILLNLLDVGLHSLPPVEHPFEHTHVIRRKDFVELFDTTSDLAGNDIDIDRFVRDILDSAVRVFWRECAVARGLPDPEEPAPERDELCPVPIGEFRDLLKKHGDDAWRWNFRDGTWEKAASSPISPGQVYMLHARAGGYVPDHGWDPKAKGPVAAISTTAAAEQDSTDHDRPSQLAVWQTIAEHTQDVVDTLKELVVGLRLTKEEQEVLRLAARWHDRGKAHEIFQAALPERDGAGPPSGEFYAKAAGHWKRYKRPMFRHELASALALLLDCGLDAALRDLAAYLVAAHHGKVRVSIRSLPGEHHPPAGQRFARGIWEGDLLAETKLGGGVVAPPVNLSLEPMEIGLGASGPFADQPSWVERTLHLRDTVGPCRLAFLEAIVRAADARGSRAAEGRAARPASSEAADA